MTKNQLSLRMGEEVDILEIFFEALSTPKNSIVIEMLSNDGAENLTENRFSGKIGANE